MSAVLAGGRILALFIGGLGLGMLLQAAGILPGHPMASVRTLFGWFHAAPRASNTVTPIDSRAVRRESDVAPHRADHPIAGDWDASRNAVRRAVIVTARAAVRAPCDLDVRVAFQVSLRDYARALGSAASRFRDEREFGTGFDGEVVRALAEAHAGGVLPAELVGRWPLRERVAVNELLARGGASLQDVVVDACRTGAVSMPRGFRAG